MYLHWLKILSEGLTCPREDAPSETASIRERTFETRLDGVKADMQKRLKENSCPKERFGNFAADGFYGKGGTAVIIRVTRHKDGEPFALKVVNKGTPTFNRRIVMEKKLTNAVRFEFIIRLHFVWQDIRRFFLFFKTAPFGSLDDQIMLRVRIMEYEAKWYAAQIILAIEYLHACGIAHRDIKPANCLLSGDRFLKVADFGFAKEVPDRTHTFCGTYSFMAPEMIRRDAYGKYVDWWAMGASIYYLLYSKLPFRGIEIDGFEAYGPLPLPEGVNPKSPAFAFCRRLLTIECSNRLGCGENGAKRIMKHPWFKDLSFRAVFTKELKLEPALEPAHVERDASQYEEMLGEPPSHELEWFDSFCSE